MIRVLLADDEAMVRAGVRAILDSGGEAEVVAEAGDGREAVELARAHRPDVALLDVRMPRLDGLAAAEEIARTVPGTAVAVLTTFSERAYVARALARRRHRLPAEVGRPVRTPRGRTGGGGRRGLPVAHGGPVRDRRARRVRRRRAARP